MPDDTVELVAERPVVRKKFWLASLAAWWGSVAMGTVIGYTAPGIPSLQHSHRIHMIHEMEGLFGSVMALGALAGGLVAGSSIEKLGRKGTLVYSSLPFVLGWVLIAHANGVAMLMIGRVLTGFCCGLISLAAPVYIAETATLTHRGFCGSGFQLFITLGIVLNFLVGKYVEWSWIAIHSAIYPILMVITACYVPESPNWLYKRGRKVEGDKAVAFLYGNDPDLTDPVNFSESEVESSKAKFADLFRRSNMIPLSISLSLMFFQQFCGINAVTFYTVLIFRAAGSTIDEHVATILVGLAQFFGTLVACILTDRAGRKPLLMLSGLVMAVTLGMMSLFFVLLHAKGEEVALKYGWLPLISLMFYVTAFALGYGPLPWLLMSEILPSSVKGLASGISTAFNWTCVFIVTLEFDNLTKNLREEGTFLGFGLLCIVGVISTAIFLPETKGKSLQEIEAHFKGDKTNRERPV